MAEVGVGSVRGGGAVLSRLPMEPGLSRHFRRLYPVVNQEETPLPRSWSLKDKCNYIGLSQDNLRVHYKGHGKNHKDAASVRATHPIPTACGIYYFEVKIVSKGRDGYMGIGLSAQGVSTNRLPGWDKHSYGYHGVDGHSFCSSVDRTALWPYIHHWRCDWLLRQPRQQYLLLHKKWPQLSMVSSYLVHHGYSSTATAFARVTDTTIQEEQNSIKNRQRIQKLVLAGRVGEAIEATQQLYPGLLEHNPNLLFMLKCRQFVEMVIGTDGEVRCFSARSLRSQDSYPRSPSLSPRHGSSNSHIHSTELYVGYFHKKEAFEGGLLVQPLVTQCSTDRAVQGSLDNKACSWTSESAKELLSSKN
ncbi:ran-binding protein 10-like isoform 2-T2 [Amazona ochrocephala]